ncbi:helix-turn-helix domain-containing protein [Pantoea ananatis]|uniref:helix-turn-helix domain-containing protein n=1 Tax=Pantoea ananas TaxID=553 RepID=UPI0020CA739C|nr:helix-turn-helix domain-containing protein [Pantoea ananatis]
MKWLINLSFLFEKLPFLFVIIITRIITQTQEDKVRAAAILGISPTTLWRKLKEYDLNS